MIGQFLPNLRLHKRRSAYSRLNGKMGLELSPNLPSLKCADKLASKVGKFAHHFRTPSPCGQLIFFSYQLPTISFQHNLLIWRSFAGSSTAWRLPYRGCAHRCMREARARHITRGPNKCVSKHGSSQEPHWRRFLHAVTQLHNKQHMVQGRGRPQRSFWTASPSRGQLSVRQATCCIVKQIRASAPASDHRLSRLMKTSRVAMARPAECVLPSHPETRCHGYHGPRRSKDFHERSVSSLGERRAVCMSGQAPVIYACGRTITIKGTT